MSARPQRASRPAPAPRPKAEPGPRRRLAPGKRRDAIVEAATRLFAEDGFAATTRDLARRLGVTQALLYRYFPSKAALVDAVFDAMAAKLRARPADDGLVDRSVDLASRLTRYYVEVGRRRTAVSVRLFMRANLEGGAIAQRYSGALTARVLRPIVGELRAQAGLPDLEREPLMRGEREIAMLLHGAVMFLGIRQHVYGMPMPDDISELVALYVRAFLPGALAEMQRLHGAGADRTLTVRTLEQRRS